MPKTPSVALLLACLTGGAHAADEPITSMLLRMGVANHWEVRLETDGRLRLKADGAGVALREHGWSGLSVGLKWHQGDGDQEAGIPGLGWLLRYRKRDDEGRPFVGGPLATVVGKSLHDRTRMFVGLSYEQLAPARHGGCVATCDVGVAYLLTRDVQVDAAISRGLNRNAPDFAWTIGLSTRF